MKNLTDRAKTEFESEREDKIVAFVKRRLQDIQNHEDAIADLQVKIAEARGLISDVEGGDYSEVPFTGCTVSGLSYVSGQPVYYGNSGLKPYNS